MKPTPEQVELAVIELVWNHLEHQETATGLMIVQDHIRERIHLLRLAQKAHDAEVARRADYVSVTANDEEMKKFEPITKKLVNCMIGDVAARAILEDKK